MGIAGRYADKWRRLAIVVFTHHITEIDQGLRSEVFCADHTTRCLRDLATEPDFAIIEQEEIELEARHHLLALAWQPEQNFELLHGVTVFAEAVAPFEDLHSLVANGDASAAAHSDMRDRDCFVHIEVRHDLGNTNWIICRVTKHLRVRVQAPAVNVCTTVASIAAETPLGCALDRIDAIAARGDQQ